ncbi:hypothetical protein ACFP2F_20455 [Hymenobacter artigasi]|uniref:Uncharacterized protein n=1 Tax=Hymenobacter artigasi TaxID=2719616 RepID=A0ABX1HN11_9BACT|nr:hypothetical protein [Hymenobacter artigasi]NKI91595.1 hypothetical protein [Hymenobacter artigasi]
MLHSPHLVTASDLTERHYRLVERGLFPDLIRRLILISDHSVRDIQFRAYESIAISGWDGSIDQAKGSTYVPAGASRWELGTNQDAASKVKSDFEKRNAPASLLTRRGRPKKNADLATSEKNDSVSLAAQSASQPAMPQEAEELVPVDSLNRSQTTLVFVVGREWPGGKEWASSQTVKSEWNAIKVFDATDIHTWLTQHSGIHLWFSRQLGSPVSGTNDIENWWLDWTYTSSLDIQSDWLLVGRSEHRDKLLKWLSSKEEAFPVFGCSAEEARAFIAACIMALSEDERLPLLGRIVIVSREDVWEQLVWEEKKLVLIFDFESTKQDRLCASATRRGHQVILACSQGLTGTEASADVLPAIMPEILQAKLEQLGMPTEIAAFNALMTSQLFTNPDSQSLKWPFLNR